MNRREAIEGIIWSLLARVDTPTEAVSGALSLKARLGDYAERDFRNVLRAAGLFARDDDGFFIRYAPSASASGYLSAPPSPTHLLTVPVPVEPRMRIAYSVFAGLLLKHIFQSHGAVPLFVTEGMALLWVPNGRPGPHTPFPQDAQDIWRAFQGSGVASGALRDGIAATFWGLRGGRPIGALEVPYSWKGTHIEELLRRGVDRNPRLFQGQSKKDKIHFTSKPKTPARAVPLSILPTGTGAASQTGAAVASGIRCIACGSAGDMIQGGKFFLPENKKQWYEEPGPRDKFPKLCAVCAYVALLSGIGPSNDQGILEFPCDNFLELFALQGQLQGLSGVTALKGINRVANLAVLPSRYLLLSVKPRSRNPNAASPMDTKAQLYSQLRHHPRLLSLSEERPFRLYLAGQGFSTLLESELHPHVAIGLSHFGALPPWTATKGDQKALMHRMVHLMLEGRPFAALYFATQARQPEKGFGSQRGVLPRGVGSFEREFTGNRLYAAKLACALGGPDMDCSIYDDVVSFSNYLLDLVRPLVEREVRKSGSSVSGIARKYTDLIARDFAECRAAKFLYVVCQEADQAERKDARWCKRQVFEVLNPGAKDDAAITRAEEQWENCDKAYDEAENELKNATDADRTSKEEALRHADLRLDEAISGVREAWDTFRKNNPKTDLECRLASLHQTHGKDAGIWGKFLHEVQARTLALLLLNVRRARS